MDTLPDAQQTHTNTHPVFLFNEPSIPELSHIGPEVVDESTHNKSLHSTHDTSCLIHYKTNISAQMVRNSRVKQIISYHIRSL